MLVCWPSFNVSMRNESRSPSITLDAWWNQAFHHSPSAWQGPIIRKTHEIGHLLWWKVTHMFPLLRLWESEASPQVSGFRLEWSEALWTGLDLLSYNSSVIRWRFGNWNLWWNRATLALSLQHPAAGARPCWALQRHRPTSHSFPWRS